MKSRDPRGLGCVRWLSAPRGPSPLTFTLAGWQECVGPLSKQINLVWEGNGLSLTRWNSRQRTLSCYCVDLWCVLTFWTPSLFLLVKSRIRVTFTDCSSVARSTWVGKEGILGTDLCGSALSGCWTSFLRFKIWPWIYWALSTSLFFDRALQTRGHTILWKTPES